MNQLLTEIRDHHRLPLAVGALGISASLVLLFCSTGSNDIHTWNRFAVAIKTSGLFELYQTDEQFNHPPLMGLLAWFSLGVSSLLGIPFAITFKIFPVLANVAAAVLLWAMWAEKADLRIGGWAFALFSWAPCVVLVAAYHGNTDCTCAFLCLLALYYLERGRPGSAGFAMAAAINVKIIPLLLVCPMLASLRSWRDARAFCLAMSVGAIPFVIALIGAGSAFVGNVFGHGSNLEAWGVRILLFQFTALPDVTQPEFTRIVTIYDSLGRFIVILSILLLSAYGFWRRLDAARLMACAFALFLLLAPRFAVQYVAYLAPLMFLLALDWGFAYALISGLFIGFVYAHFQIGSFPLESDHNQGEIPMQAAYLGFAAWWTILCFTVACLRSKHRFQSGTTEPSAGS